MSVPSSGAARAVESEYNGLTLTLPVSPGDGRLAMTPSPTDPAPLSQAATLVPSKATGAAFAQAEAPAPERIHIPSFEVVEEIGRGGMGVVYKARQVQLNRLVALKMVLAGKCASRDELDRFRVEAEAVAQLQHPGIVQIYEIGCHEGLPYFSMEYCGGGSLSARMDGTPWPQEKAAALVEELARAMDYAHRQQIIHRDLKPGNVLLTADGAPKITDFGLAKRLQQAGQTVTGTVLGTPSYMAPEQAEGHTRGVGPATDIYALGAILYELLTGRPPFKAASSLDTVMQVISSEPVPPRLLNRQLSPDLENVTLKCLEKDPAKRYPSAGALADDLRRFLNGEEVVARSINLLERLQRELSHSSFDATLRPWGAGLMLMGAMVFFTHLSTSLLLVAGLREVLSFWVPRTVELFVLGGIVYRSLPQGRLWPASAAERLIWAVWIGYLLTLTSLHWVMRLQGHTHLQVYGVSTAVYGLVWFVMGAHVWGGCYVLGGLLLVLAPALALVCRHDTPWTPFLFGFLASAPLALVGLRYWRLGASVSGKSAEKLPTTVRIAEACPPRLSEPEA